METIVAAAIKCQGMTLSLPQPARHHNIIHWMADVKLQPRTDQGFITSTGRYVNRKEGLVIARAAGQVDEIIGGDLTSEDLW